MNRRLIGGYLGGLAAVVVVILFIVEFVDSKNEVRSLKEQLEACKERNQQVFSLLVVATSQGKVTYSDLSQYLSEPEAKDIAEKAGLRVEANFPFSLETQFSPSGWMGDGQSGTEYTSLGRVRQLFDGREKVVIRVDYRRGPKGWAGMYWQFPDGNWGDESGKSLWGAGKISFLARGATGDEIVEFKAGGIRGKKYSDSFEKSLGKVALSSTWQEFVIDLSREDLSNVIGAFAWIAAASDNPSEIRFYIADLQIDQ